MNKIIRTPTRAEGGITPEEKAKMDAITQKWIKNAFRTEPINKDKITQAIYGLYEAANLEHPRVVIVPSPKVMAFAYGLSAGLWYLKEGDATRAATHAATRDATDAATDAATDDATYAATDAATRDATDAATRAATRAATDDATRDATDAATRVATRDATRDATHDATHDKWLYPLALELGKTPENAKFLIACISRWYNNYQGGNMWSYFGAYTEAMKDVLGLTGLECWEKYQSWQEASQEGGFRVMHEKFCIVSDFPKTLLVDEQNRPHCDSGPSHEWRDGFKLFYLHGVKFDEETHRKLVNGEFTAEDLHGGNLTSDQSSEALFWLPPEKLLSQIKAQHLHTGIKGTKLYKVDKFLDATEPQYCMVMEHPTIKGKMYLEWVDPEVGKQKDADLAQCYAWQDDNGNPIPYEDYLMALEA